MTPLFKKLNLGKIDSILVLNVPESFESELAQLEGISISRRATKQNAPFGIAFAATQAELDRVSRQLLEATGDDAVFWIAYPKGTSKKYRCDFNRDTGWTVLGDAGFEGVRMVAIDDDWSALRFRKAERIKSLTRRKTMALSKEGKRRAKE